MIVVTSGAIARGMRVMELPQRPTTIGDLQAASAVGQGKLYRVYDELLRERGVTSAQVLLTFFDMSARTHYLNARQTLTTLLEWRVLPVINENDTTATDEISFGDNDFLAAQVAVLVGADELILLTDIDGLYTADPRLHPDARIVARGERLRRARRARDRPHDLAARLGRHALEGRRRRDGHGRRDRHGDLQRDPRAGAGGGARGRARGHPLPGRRGALQQLQAVAEVRQALARHARGRRRRRRGRCARAARACCRSAWSRCAASSTPGDAVEIAERARTAAAAAPAPLAKGICNYSAEELRQVMGLKSEPCARSCRGRPRRPCTATTSCSTEGSYPVGPWR